jgi:uncharacterized protein with PQ loop repeat
VSNAPVNLCILWLYQYSFLCWAINLILIRTIVYHQNNFN